MYNYTELNYIIVFRNNSTYLKELMVLPPPIQSSTQTLNLVIYVILLKFQHLGANEISAAICLMYLPHLVLMLPTSL